MCPCQKPPHANKLLYRYKSVSTKLFSLCGIFVLLLLRIGYSYFRSHCCVSNDLTEPMSPMEAFVANRRKQSSAI